MNGSSVTTIAFLRAVTFSTCVAARVVSDPRPDSYASRMPSRPMMMPPPGQSGPGT